MLCTATINTSNTIRKQTGAGRNKSGSWVNWFTKSETGNGRTRPVAPAFLDNAVVLTGQIQVMPTLSTGSGAVFVHGIMRRRTRLTGSNFVA